MPLLGSRVGYALAVLYLGIVGYIVQDELRHTGGGWINLRGMGTVLVTAPSQATLGVLLKKLGVPQVNYNEPGLLGYAQLITHVLLSAVVVYLVGYGLEWGVRRVFSTAWRS